MKIPETLKMPSLSGLGKRPQGILRNQSIRGFFGFKYSFQNGFWNVFSTSGLSQICKIRNGWKLPSPFSWNTVIPMLWKDFLEFKNIILEENLIIKLKNSHGNFSGETVSMVLELLAWICQNHEVQGFFAGNLTWKKFFMTVFEFIWQFFFQNDVFNLQEVFSEHSIRVFHEKVLGSFQPFLILQIWDKPDVLKPFQKQFWKLDLKPKKPLLWFRKIPCGLFPKPLKEGIFSLLRSEIRHLVEAMDEKEISFHD
jgi:hypothetical protein